MLANSNLRLSVCPSSPPNRPDDRITRDDFGKVNVSVAVRLRPLNDREIELGGCERDHWLVQGNEISSNAVHSQQFMFDKVFTPEHSNDHVYEVMAKSLVQSALQGFNATIFAYGQTASGKTFTMQGIIRHSIADLFKYVADNSQTNSWVIKMTYVELYQEEIRDLVGDEKSSASIRIRENISGETVLENVKEILVVNENEALATFERGEKRRQVGSTNMNLRSSRSHAILTFIIECFGMEAQHEKQKSKASVRCARLNLVDLAGSERIAHTGASGIRLREGAYINRSLLALTTVIAKLTAPNSKERLHVPYRDSKLTRILQPSLGGNAKTSIICNVTPFYKHADESLSTLKFAFSAKTIKNKPKVNMIADNQSADVYKETIKALEDRLAAAEAKNDKMEQLTQLLGSLKSSSKRPSEEEHEGQKRIKMDEKETLESIVDQVQILTRERVQTMDRLKSLLDERDGIEEDFRKAVSEIEEKNMELEKIHEDMNSLKTSLDQRETLLASTQKELTYKLDLLDLKEAAFNDLQTQYELIKTSRNALQTDIDEHASQLQLNNAELDRLRAELVTAQDCLSNLKCSSATELDSLKATHESMQASLSEKKQTILQLQEKICSLEPLTSDLSNAMERINVLEKDVDAYQARLSDLEQSNETANWPFKLEQAQKETNQLQAELASELAQKRELEALLKDMEHRLQTSSTEIERVNQLLNDSRNTDTAQQEQVCILKERLALQDSQNASAYKIHQEAVDKLQSRLEELTNVNERLRECHEADALTLKQMRDAESQYLKDLESRAHDTSKVQSELETLRCEHAQMIASIKTQQGTLREQEVNVKTKQAEHVAQIQEHTRTIAELEQKLVEATCALAQVKLELQNKCSRIVDLETSAEAERQKLSQDTLAAEADRTKYMQQVSDLKEAISSGESRIVSLNEQVQLASSLSESLRSELGGMHESLQGKTQEIIELRNLLKSTQAQSSEKCDKLSTAEDQLVLLQQQLNDKQACVAELSKQLQDACMDRNQLETAKLEVTRELSKKEHLLAELQNELSSSRANETALANTAISLNTDISQLQACLDTQLNQNGLQFIEISRLSEEIERLSSTSVETYQLVAKLAEEKEALRHGLELSEKNLEWFQLDRRSLQALQSNLSKDLKKHLETIEAMQCEYMALEEKYGKQIQREKDQEKVRTHLEQDAREFETLYKHAANDVRKAKGQLREVQLRYDELVETEQAKHAESQAQLDKINELSNEISSLHSLHDVNEAKLKLQEHQQLSLLQALESQKTASSSLELEKKELCRGILAFANQVQTLLFLERQRFFGRLELCFRLLDSGSKY